MKKVSEYNQVAEIKKRRKAKKDEKATSEASDWKASMEAE